MTRLLFVVEDIFEVEGRIIPFPGIRPEGDEVFHIGDKLLLKREDGSEQIVEISSLEILVPNPRKVVSVVFKGIDKKVIPLGTEVWSMVEG